MAKNREQDVWPVSRGLFGQFSSWLSGRRADRARLAKAFAVYHVIVARARQPVFYADWGVPDTTDGRLEMIGVHAALVMRRLRVEGEAGKTLAQDIFDVMFADVDRNFREQGVGDLSVGKHVKRAAQTFLARFHALDPGFDAGDRGVIAAVLERNIFNRVVSEKGEAATDQPAELDPPTAGMLALADHLLREEALLRDLPGSDLLAGRLNLTVQPHIAPA